MNGSGRVGGVFLKSVGVYAGVWVFVCRMSGGAGCLYTRRRTLLSRPVVQYNFHHHRRRHHHHYHHYRHHHRRRHPYRRHHHHHYRHHYHHHHNNIK